MKLKVLESVAWYAQGLRFSCAGCGNCCTGGPGFVWLEDWELQRLADFLNLPVEDALARYARRIGQQVSLRELRTAQGNYDCIFLRQQPPPAGAKGVVLPQRTCAIYPVRPLQCRTWPFWHGNLSSRAAWQRAAQRCPGMDRGPVHDRPRIEALRDARQWP